MSNFVPLEDAARRLGMTADELVEMRMRGDIFGYRDGRSWKFKPEEIERVASEIKTMIARDVFIAHASKDKSIADAICIAMEQKSIRCWLASRDILPRFDWGTSIANAIENCKVVVLVFSTASRQSRQILNEIAHSDREGKPLIVFRISDIKPWGEMVFYLSSVHRVDALSPPMEPHIDRLIDLVRTVIGPRLTDSKTKLGDEISETTQNDSVLADDDELVLEGSDLALGNDSGINLMSPSDSGIEISQGEEFQLSPSGSIESEDDSGDLHAYVPFSAYTGAAPYVFVSYSHKDGRAVFKDLQPLHNHGFRIWYDEGIDPGNEWPDEIARAIDSCSQFIVFISPNAVESQNVRNEINFALNKRKPILAVHLQQTVLPLGLQLQIGSIQAVMRYRLSEATFLAKLQKVLSSSLRV